MKKNIDVPNRAFVVLFIAVLVALCCNGITTGVPALLLLLVPKLILVVPYFI